MPPHEHTTRPDAARAAQVLSRSVETDRSRELPAHAQPFALSPEAAGVPALPEAEPFVSQR